MSEIPAYQRRRLTLFLALLLLLLIGAFFATSERMLGSRGLPLGGSLTWPNPAMMAFYGMWSFLATITGLLAVALIHQSVRNPTRVATWVLRIKPVFFVSAMTLTALLIPTLLRTFILGQAPLTDDESAYQFSAQLLANGQLTADSPPMKLFFDRSFMINDGHWYTQYFLGWPALMVPFVWLTIPGYANCLYAAITVPALHYVGKRLLGWRWARVTLLLYAASPMLMLGAATSMSHTSCMAALVFLTAATLRAIDRPHNICYPILVALFFSLAFFIRPLTGLGLGIVPLVAWTASVARKKFPIANILAFGATAAVGASLFLWVNYEQNGNPFLVSYQRMHSYTVENGYRFTHKMPIPEGVRYVANMNIDDLTAGITTIASALFRLNIALFAWPSGLLVILCARQRRSIVWIAASVAVFLAANLFNADAGVDTFGPVHFHELALPVLLLTTMGLASATQWLGRVSNAIGPKLGQLNLAPLPLIAALSMSTVGFFTLGLPRFAAIRAITDSVNESLDLPADSGAENAVVFTDRAFVRYCQSYPARGWVFWHPDLNPDIHAENIVWVNHISLAEDRKLMTTVFPQRTGYFMRWGKNCVKRLVPLSVIPDGVLPDGRQVRPGLKLTSDLLANEIDELVSCSE